MPPECEECKRIQKELTWYIEHSVALIDDDCGIYNITSALDEIRLLKRIIQDLENDRLIGRATYAVSGNSGSTGMAT